VPISLMQMVNSAAHSGLRTSAARPSATASATSSSSSSGSTTDPGIDLTNTFLQLLTVQLQNQSPLDPLDPNQFVVQLAQFDSLGELTQIQELMQTLVNNTSGSPTPAAAAAIGANSNSASMSQLNPITH